MRVPVAGGAVDERAAGKAQTQQPCHLVERLPRGIDTLLIGGGVAANSRLRALAAQRCAAAGVTLRVPRPKLCTDNGAMVAALGAHLLAAGALPSVFEIPADPALPVTTSLV